MNKKHELLMLLEEKARRKSIIYWLKGKKNEKGELITLDNHEFQRDIWEDFSPTMAVRKCAQVGVSTIFILKCPYLMERHGYNIIYTLPTLQNDVQKFVPSKVDPILENNGFTFGRDKTTLKQIGSAFWHFGGTFSEKEGISTTADVVVHDEVDRSNLDVIGTYKSRLGHSQYARRWFFSNPSAPNRGVDHYFQLSDQKHWFVKCECGQGNYGGWQYLSWPENVDYKNGRYICIHCGREITPEVKQQGQWVAKHPDRDISGYWVSKMMAPWIPCSSLIEDERDESPAYFNNFCLGLPYVGADMTVTRDILLRNISERTPLLSNNYAGVDVGQQLHVVVQNDEGIVKILTTTWDGLDHLFLIYDFRNVVIDALPETTKAKEFQERHKGRVKICYYDTHETRKGKPSTQELYEVDYGQQALFNVKRNECIDRVIRAFNEHEILIFLSPKEPVLAGGYPLKRNESYAEHWENIYLFHDEDKDVKYWEHAGPDHYVHATVYSWLAKRTAGAKVKHKVKID